MLVAATEPTVFAIGGVTVRIRADDPEFVTEFSRLFADDGPPGVEAAALDIDLRARDSTFEVSGDALPDPAAFLASFHSPDIPLEWDGSSTAERPVLSLRGEPTFSFEGPVMRFRQVQNWRRMLAHVAFLRVLRMRPDSIFLHAGSVNIDGRGVLLIGPKGSGKTTLAAALACRGHGFLGDETAMCRARDLMLLPFRRPLCIKPGPGSAAVAEALRQRPAQPDELGIVRVPISRIVRSERAQAAVLRAVIFLQPFAEQPQLERVEQPGRAEAALLQPMGSSLSAEDAPKRIFAMFRLLTASTVFRLRPGDADDTALIIEETIKTL